MAGLYIHIPFCRQACHYCDFHFSTQLNFREELVRAIADELRLQKNYPGSERINTIYFGGGTPSLLRQDELLQIFSAVRDHYNISTDAEITLEANPDDLTPEKLDILRHMGINRLSIGIQSFDDVVLKFLNRAHDARHAVQSMHDARAAGFQNISIDLMYAIPGQTPETWERNIAAAAALMPEHISAYSLTLEEKTVFGKWQQSGKLKAVEEEVAADQFEFLMDALTGYGYEQYEISNFSKPGFPSRHNSNYWRQEIYLGTGPSAHSYNLETRQANISNNAQYVKSIKDGIVPFDREVLKREDKINEYLFTTLRTSWGSNLEKLQQDFGYDLKKESGPYLTSLTENGLATIENNVMRLTRPGKLLADKIASDLFTDDTSNS